MPAPLFGIATGAFVDERDDWERAVERAAVEGWQTVELTAISESRYASLLAYLRDRPDALMGFERVSMHAPVAFESSASAAAARLAASSLPFDVVLHPDCYGREGSLVALSTRAVFENMDSNKRFGRDVRDLAEVFDLFPEAGFCLDVAHVWTNDASLGLGFDLLSAYGDRLRQLHVSGIGRDGTHRPTTADDLALYEPLLELCGVVPWILESELAAS
jgi:hypothetical protein